MTEPEPTKPTRVEIAAGGHQVVIETEAPLTTVANVALELWRATDDKAITKGYGTSVGFHTELVLEEPYVEDEPGSIGLHR